MKHAGIVRLAVLALILTGSQLEAAVITFTQTLNNFPVTARVTTTFGLNSLTIVLDQLVANPTSVIQGVAAIDFDVTGGLNGTLTGVSGQLITIGSDKSFANLSGIPNWQKQSANDFLTTTLVGNNKNVLIGAPGGSTYANANGSIAGNNGHPAWVSQSLTLTYAIQGVNSSSGISNLRLGFGTVPAWVSPDPGEGTNSAVPEPATCGLIGGSLLLLKLLVRRS